MTLALEQRRRLRAPQDRRTMADDLSESLFVLERDARSLRWPSPKYRKDPVGFCRDILGIDLWEKQIQIAETVRDNPATTVKSGHRIGKSTIAAALALWFWCSFEDAQVVMTAPVARQVQDTLWRALSMLYERAGRCLPCKTQDPSGPRPCPHSALLDGELAQRASTGLKGHHRKIHGITAKDVEAIQGIAGADLFFVLDEASGIADAIYKGIDGNRAGLSDDDAGTMVRLLLIGNPTQTSGEFYDSHEHPRKKLGYKQITVSSRETPNAVQGRVVIKALATRDWIAQMEAKYGADSAFVKVRVDGVFPIGEDGKAFPIHMITESQQRRDDASEAGPLFVGIDPSGESGMGDDAAFSARRDMKQLALRTFLGLSPEGHALELDRLLSDLNLDPRERAIVVVDAEGPTGTAVYRHLAAVARKRGSRFDVFAVRASDPAWREPMQYDRVRDELAANLHRWMKEGGAILDEEEMLEQELHVLEWEAMGGKRKITPKKKIRQELGHSPDRYDATALSVWVPSEATRASGRGRVRDIDDEDDGHRFANIGDPHAHRDAIDPFGHRD